MKVAVVGPGALGCLFAARLAVTGGHRVCLVDHRPDRLERLRKHGIRVETQREPLHASPKLSQRVPAKCGLVIVLVKSHVTPQLELPPEVPVLTLQNGLNNIETLGALVGNDQILAGSTSEAATLLQEGVTRHVAHGKTRFGAWTTCPAQPALELLQEAGFDAALTPTPGEVIWEKVAINSGINPLTAILNVPNGHLLALPETRALLRDLVVEAVKVAAAEGYRFERSLLEAAEDTCRATSENISSMLQDIRAGRRTEIESISGEILRRAQRFNLHTPRTRMAYQLVRGLENR